MHVLDAEGRWRTAALTSVPPVGDADGNTLEERGAARYLGVYFSFEGCGSKPWAEQDGYAKELVNGFFARCALLDPDVRQYCMLVESLLASKLLYGGRIRRPPESELEEIRQRCVKGLEALLHLGALGGGGRRTDAQECTAAADVEMLLAPVEAMGGGVPDVRASLLGETAVDLLTMLASRAPAGRAAAAAAFGSNELKATHLWLRQEGGLKLHGSAVIHAPVAAHTATSASVHAEASTTAKIVTARVGTAYHAAEATTTASPEAEGSNFTTEAALVVWSTGLLFRALREDEVVWRDGMWQLQDGVLKPKQRDSNMTVERAVAAGSKVDNSRWVHTTSDPCAAAYFAKAHGRGAGIIAVLDAELLSRAGVPLIDLRQQQVRRAHGIMQDSLAERAAVAAAELLLDAETVKGTCVLALFNAGGQLQMRRKPRGIWDMLDSLTAEAQAWLWGEVRRYHNQCTWMQARAGRPRELLLVTDASLQAPQAGVMETYLQATTTPVETGQPETAKGLTWLSSAATSLREEAELLHIWIDRLHIWTEQQGRRPNGISPSFGGCK